MCTRAASSREGDSLFFNSIHSGITEFGDCKSKPTSEAASCPYQS